MFTAIWKSSHRQMKQHIKTWEVNILPIQFLVVTRLTILQVSVSILPFYSDTTTIPRAKQKHI